ncbi:hypothetical protein AAFF_G00147390 [Aldrovandia affinis]|uniref:Uncharacterized protein n=1 Tax=Aldrovandia affinis TaxID=143900 RepID=A0AAD7W8Q7_9TELE|nr:hypothetical protein AAFF_G00147390 [Aldrovandia affinis]
MTSGTSPGDGARCQSCPSVLAASLPVRLPPADRMAEACLTMNAQLIQVNTRDVGLGDTHTRVCARIAECPWGAATPHRDHNRGQARGEGSNRSTV